MSTELTIRKRGDSSFLLFNKLVPLWQSFNYLPVLFGLYLLKSYLEGVTIGKILLDARNEEDKRKSLVLSYNVMY